MLHYSPIEQELEEVPSENCKFIISLILTVINLKGIKHKKILPTKTNVKTRKTK